MNNYDDLLTNVPAAEGQNGQQLSKEEYAAKKQAEREAVYTMSDNAALEVAGSGDKFKQYLDVQSTFDRYSAVNALLIMAQRPDATRVADFDHWKSKGASVKGGQTGIFILEPGKEYERKDGQGMAIGYNLKKVFDISQVDTRRMTQPKPTPNYTDRQLLTALINKAPVKITGVDSLPDGGGAKYDPEMDSIAVLKGMEFSDTFRSLAHELAYADLTTGPDPQADPQFSAYCASYILCQKYGVDTGKFNFDSAPSVLNEMDAQTIKSELQEIRDTAANIGERMSRQLDTPQRTARDQGEAR